MTTDLIEFYEDLGLITAWFKDQPEKKIYARTKEELLSHPIVKERIKNSCNIHELTEVPKPASKAKVLSFRQFDFSGYKVVRVYLETQYRLAQQDLEMMQLHASNDGTWSLDELELLS